MHVKKHGCIAGHYPFFTTLVLFILTFLSPSPLLNGSHPKTASFVISAKGKIYRLSDANRWLPANQGLPPDIRPLRIHVHHTDMSHAYLTTESHGIFRMDIRQGAWEDISSHKFNVRSVYKEKEERRKISAFAVDCKNSRRLLCATKHTLYESPDRGSTWRRHPMKGLGSKNYITSLAVTGPFVAAGTSFNGVFVSRGGRFRSSNTGLPNEPYSGSLVFFDEVTSLRWSDGNRVLFAGFACGSGLYASGNQGGSWYSCHFSADSDTFHQVDDACRFNGRTCVSSAGTVYMRDPSAGWAPTGMHAGESMPAERRGALVHLCAHGPALFTSFPEKARNSHRSNAGDKRAIYTNVYTIRKNLDRHINTIRSTGLNAVVIDMKDDFGYVHFPSENKTARDIGAVKKPIPLSRILAAMKNAGIYCIARIVVFKDRQLYRSFNGAYAVKDRTTGAPWQGNPREYWVDPHAEFVHRYNIDLARECQELGFDEIQFDYIRFPSDGATEKCAYQYRPDPDMYKSEVLTDFLSKARSELTVNISTDIYGFNAWYRFGNWIGQDMEEFARHVDVICPMVYPSHFGRSFYMKGERSKRPYRIVHDSGKRAFHICGEVIIRPYLQAFNLLSPTWGPGYINNQIKGARESNCSGYTFWNAAGNYAMLKRALSGEQAND